MRTVEQQQAAFNGLSTRWIADDLGTDPDHVVKLIKAGAFEDVADISTGRVPRYRVSRESYERFLERRRVAAS